MGDRCTIGDWHLEVDVPALREWVKEPVPEWIEKGFKGKMGKIGGGLDAYKSWLQELKKLLNENPTWNGKEDDVMESFATLLGEGKILSYWYPGYCTFLRELAQFVNGYVTMQLYCEALGSIEFKDGECFVKQVNLSAQNAEDIEKFVNNAEELPKMPKRVRLMRKL